jgi:hypothetical protein
MDELKNMIASVLAVVHQSTNELKESNKALEIKIEASTRKLREDNKKFQRNMEDKFLAFQETVNNDIRSETEKVIKRFEG